MPSSEHHDLWVLSRSAKAACSGVANPWCSVASSAAKSPAHSAAGWSHRPGNTVLRSTPCASGASEAEAGGWDCGLSRGGDLRGFLG